MDLSKMITINETGSLLFKAMENDVTLEHLCQVLKTEYEGASDDEIKNIMGVGFVKFINTLTIWKEDYYLRGSKERETRSDKNLWARKRSMATVFRNARNCRKVKKA